MTPSLFYFCPQRGKFYAIFQNIIPKFLAEIYTNIECRKLVIEIKDHDWHYNVLQQKILCTEGGLTFSREHCSVADVCNVF